MEASVGRRAGVGGGKLDILKWSSAPKLGPSVVSGSESPPSSIG